MFLDLGAYAAAREILRPEDFWDQRNRAVYEAILATNGEVDILTVCERLDAKGQANIADALYVSELVNTVPNGLHGRRYAQIVAEKAERRRVIAAVQEVATKAFDLTTDVSALYSMATEKLSKAARSATQKYRSMDDLTLDAANLFTRRIEAEGKLLGYSSGVVDLDKLLCGFQKGRLIIVSGRPGSGKSVLMGQSSLRASEGGAHVLHYPLEMGESEVILRMAKNLAQVSYRTGEEYKLIPAQRDSIYSAIQRIYSEFPLSVRINHSINAIVQECEIARRHGALDMVVIDQLQNVVPDVGRRDAGTRDAELGAATRALKQMALTLDIPVILGSALNRQAEGTRPTLSSLRESGSIESDADVVIGLWQEDPITQPNVVTASVIKNRDNETGDARLFFAKGMHRFGDLRIVSPEL
jgi:replicative DNA helicase